MLTASRLIGLVRELLISVAFGFSRFTDAFYQATFALVSLQTVTNGPFTTSFSARFASSSKGDRLAYLMYYTHRLFWLGTAIFAAMLLGAASLRLAHNGFSDLSLPLLVLAPAAPVVLFSGYAYAVTTSFGRIATAATILLVSNASFVFGIFLLWASGLSLTLLSLPILFTISSFVGFIYAVIVYRRILNELRLEAPTILIPRRLDGFGFAFILASTETAFFLLTQFVVLSLATSAGAGWVSAVSVVQRIMFSVNGLIISPAASLLMLKVIAQRDSRYHVFARTIVGVASGLVAIALSVALILPPALNYLVGADSPRHGSIALIAELLPPYALWLIPIGLNILICRVMFGLKLDRMYTFATVTAYAVANCARLVVAHYTDLPSAIAAGALIELCCVVFLFLQTRSFILDTRDSSTLVMFTMAFHSGMGRFASEMVKAAGNLARSVVFVAPPMDSEPGNVPRVFFERPRQSRSRFKKIYELSRMNLSSTWAVWRSSSRRSVIIMVDLYSTVPLSIFPAWAARVRGARTVLNLHDFYPHASRFPEKLVWLEHWLFRMAYRQFDIVATMKQDQRERLIREAGVASEKIVTIQHGAFPIDGVRAPENSQEVIRILILGSLRENKCVLESIEAIKHLQSTNKNVVLRIAGAPRREEAAYWARCKRALESMERVELYDRFIDDAEMGEILSDVDIMLCPYEGFDSQSGVSIVGVSNGIPLVATRSAFVAGAAAAQEVFHPVSSEGICAALAAAIKIPRSQRLTNANQEREFFERNSLWVEALRIIDARLSELYGLRIAETPENLKPAEAR